MRYSWECNKCGQKGQQDKLIRFCPRCGNRLEITYNSVNDNSSFDFSQIKDKAHEQFCETFEFDKLDGFNFSNFIRQMFKWHTWDEIEDYICQGTFKCNRRTPPLRCANATLLRKTRLYGGKDAAAEINRIPTEVCTAPLARLPSVLKRSKRTSMLCSAQSLRLSPLQQRVSTFAAVL